MNAKPCPCCRGPVSVELELGERFVRCVTGCAKAPRISRTKAAVAIQLWNRLVDEFKEVA